MTKLAWRHKRKYLRAKQRETYTMLGLSLISLVVFGTFAIRPTLTTIVKLRRNIKDQEETCKRLDQKLKSLSLDQAELKKISADLPVIEKALPKEEDFANILETLHIISEKNNLRLEHIRFNQNNTIPQTVETVPFRIRTEGGFLQTVAFMKNVQNTVRIFNPKKVYITGQKNSTTETFELETEAYFYQTNHE